MTVVISVACLAATMSMRVEQAAASHATNAAIMIAVVNTSHFHNGAFGLKAA